MPQTALVIGGTGPTGHYIVNGLRQRGLEVAILHTGRHEVDEIPADVEHIHTNPFDEAAVARALGNRKFDLTVATYGRLRMLAKLFVGRTGRFVSVGGVPAYRGYMNAEVFEPAGLPVPTTEDAPKSLIEAEDDKGFRVYRSECEVFEHHPDATHFRYPYIYGRYQLLPTQWCVIRRILDRRPYIVVPEDGLTLNHCAYAENAAHALLLAVDRPDVAAGQIYHCGDEHVLTLRQVIETCAQTLGHEWQVVSMPWHLAVSARPMIAQPWTTHRVFDLAKLKSELGYRDVVTAADAVARTARWLSDNPLAAGGPEEQRLQDPFDYQAEDRLVAAWRRTIAEFPDIEFDREPGYSSAYSGPGGSSRTRAW